MSAAPLLAGPDTPPSSPTLLRALLLGHPATEGVELLLWPEDEGRRRELEVLERPCLLLLADDTPAPTCGPLEDWVRAPSPVDDAAARCSALVGRMRCAARPVVHDDALEFAGQRVDLPPGQVRLARVLADHYRDVAKRDQLMAAAGNPSDDALKAALARLAGRLAPVGLSVRTIRGVGHLLEPSSGCGSRHRHVANASDCGS